MVEPCVVRGNKLCANPSPCRLRDVRTFCYLESVGSVPVLGIFYLTFKVYSPSFSTLFWPTFSSLKHGIKWLPVLWLLLGFGQWSGWWETTEQNRVRVLIHPGPTLSQEVTAALHWRPCSCWAPVRQWLLWPLPLQEQGYKNLSPLPIPDYCFIPIAFPKPCPHLCK